MLRPVGHAKMSKSEGNFETIRDAIDRWGRETLLLFFLTGHWSKPIDYSDETVRAAEARKESLREVFRNPSEPAPEGDWERFVDALDDDFNTPEALAVMHSWRDHDLLRRALDVFGLASLAERGGAPPEIVELAADGKRRGRPATSPRPIVFATRSRDRAGRCATSPTASSSFARHVQRDQVYGRRPVREALRGRRQILELWASERALAAEPWLRDAPLRVQVKQERALSEAAGTRDHQGVLAWTEPYRYADAWELAAQERALLVCLDRVTDPRNLGAVCRAADGAGATGVVVPSHGPRP